MLGHPLQSKGQIIPSCTFYHLEGSIMPDRPLGFGGSILHTWEYCFTLYQVTRKSASFKWGPEQERARQQFRLQYKRPYFLGPVTHHILWYKRIYKEKMHHVKFMVAPKWRSQLIHTGLWNEDMLPAAENYTLFKTELLACSWPTRHQVSDQVTVWPELFIKA